MTPANRYATAAGHSPDALVQEHAPLVKRIANHLRGRLPHGVDLDDLLQVGLIALLDAARQYSPAKGASFETYASIRVRGAMLDEVRSTDWTPRSVYRRQRELTAAIQKVENRTGNPAEPREIAAELGISLDDYFQMVSAATTHRLFSLDQDEDSGNESRLQEIPDPDAEPCTELESDEFRAALGEAIRTLPEREALVMSLYYEEELNLKEIGEVLGVTESRVCQIHGQALSRVRARVHAAVGGLVATP
ncbi:MAG: RNA polymerase sigma factor FliA [Gammaproteobacteria bacterium]|jgi:RNA polymerase sigma factor for flagellar operon FliA|nr:RNA polymerase sigma factor FliA [Gammaproteobacteria bacterium]